MMSRFMLFVSLIGVDSLIMSKLPSSGHKLRSTRLYVSKHLVSYSKRSGEEMASDIKPIDPKKVAMLQRLGLESQEISQKTGAELRKSRKDEARVSKIKQERAKAKATKTSFPVKTKSNTPEKAVRFVLGNGVEALTATNLLDLVKSTAPYIFPETAPKLVLDESDYELMMEYDDDFASESKVEITKAAAEAPQSHSSTNENNTPILEANNGAFIISKPPMDLYSAESAASSSSTSTSDSASASVLAKLSHGPMGWLDILQRGSGIPNTSTPTEAQRVDYYTLCIASHFATVATYVPTDVDSKIRGHCWNDPSEAVLLEQYKVLKNALKWDVDAVSRKTIRVKDVDEGYPISGHMGEWLGALAGAWGAFLRIGNMTLANEIEGIIEHELQREVNAFRKVRLARPSTKSDTILLKLASVLTHNVGDVDQGLSYWAPEEKEKDKEKEKEKKETAAGSGSEKEVEKEVEEEREAEKEKKQKGKSSVSAPFEFQAQLSKYSRLAHERPERFGGEFLAAKTIYKELVSAEGHRNYPLREPKFLRTIPDLMLPFGPWYESWGRMVGTHPALSQEDKIQVIRQLLRGCDSTSRAWCVPNQVGYYRALNGINSVMNLDLIAKVLDKDCRTVLKSHDVRFHLSLSEEAFAARLGTQAREILEMNGFV